MKRALTDLWVGLFVSMGIIAISFLALQSANLSNQGKEESYTLYAEFDNVGNLAIRAPVKSSGVLIGRVIDIQLNAKKYLARVTFSVNNRYRFSRDVSAEILTAGLLGEQYINLTQGAEPFYIEPNEQVTLTSSAVVLEQLIDKFITGWDKK
ncbi:MAG: outer membrane lipid asymmetry maintenance protein MlaD [Neisseriales bacterium]|nr:MAG: outer membrane lipid asymmetry maintenance protein MlaD [Neisseriales bacterium]